MIPTNAKQHPVYLGYYITPNGEVWSSKSNKKLKVKEYFDPRRNEDVGYMKLGIYFNGLKLVKLHRLVAETFIPNPHNLPCVNHLDGDKHNNSVSNLEWCSAAHNTRHAFKTGLVAKNTYTILFRSTGETFEITNLSSFCRSFGLSPNTLTRTMKGRSKNCLFEIVKVVKNKKGSFLKKGVVDQS